MQLENLQRSIQTNSSLIGQFFSHIRKSHLLFQSETSKNILTEIFIASTQQQMAAEFFKNSSNSSLIGQFFRHIKPSHLFSNQNSNLKISASSDWTSQLHLGKFAEECFRNLSKKMDLSTNSSFISQFFLHIRQSHLVFKYRIPLFLLFPIYRSSLWTHYIGLTSNMLANLQMNVGILQEFRSEKQMDLPMERWPFSSCLEDRQEVCCFIWSIHGRIWCYWNKEIQNRIWKKYFFHAVNCSMY